MSEEAKKCPRCSLMNPGIAQRCDCGYDFERGTVEKPYFRQRLPKEIKTYISIVIISNLLGIIGVLKTGDLLKIILIVVWSIAVYSLYSELIKKKNWARVTLIVITFPIGLILGLSNEAKLYCMQKD